ncbi:MAG: hypothetical protein QOD51_1887 [Candidatus Eremiobacteraeota bacterium]|jgi:uncharacterized membrane protein|nr:hypothetical protein [Candidatus Eremiobacteraeota bacterium]
MVQDPNQSSFGLSPNVAAGLAALFGWVGGLVILLGKPPQSWVRFVAVQAIILSVAVAVGFIAIMIVGAILGMIFSALNLGIVAAIIGLILFCAYLVLIVAYFVATLMTTIQGFQGKALRLPYIAQYADRWATAPTPL